MKAHIRLKLAVGAPLAAAPHWTRARGDKTLVPERLHPDVDRIMQRHGQRIWATREFEPRGTHWDASEVAAGLDRVYRLILQREGRVPRALIDDLRLVPAVEEVRAGQIGADELPPLQPSALAMDRADAARTAIRLPQAHDVSRGDRTIVVAVLDTGIDLGHPELRDALLPGMDFVDIIDGAGQFLGDHIGADEQPDDEVGHGTHVAGIIAGAGLRMSLGVAPRCRILPVRVLASLQRGSQRVGAGLVDNIDAGVKWAVDQGADVINMSLGVRHEGGGLPHADVVAYARSHGVTVVAASGNDGTDSMYYPGALDGVIAVGAVGHDGAAAPFSTYGPQVMLTAPGIEVLSAGLDGGYAHATGTSHAAPFVAGAAALLRSHARSRRRRLGDGGVQHVLKHSADRPGPRFKDRRTGFGTLNVADALRLLDHKLDTSNPAR